MVRDHDCLRLIRSDISCRQEHWKTHEYTRQAFCLEFYSLDLPLNDLAYSFND